ncbi:hypothetical protein CRENBAI_024601 [Crenichthys baileyi]|uniref:Uncharacterized protein n=1 Tax=Crenichthys baileyi TaxID=28760 RepID=A0AAV9SNB8_9TELE
MLHAGLKQLTSSLSLLGGVVPQLQFLFQSETLVDLNPAAPHGCADATSGLESRVFGKDTGTHELS